MRMLSKAADRLVAMVVPKVEAAAAPCDCDPGSHWWGEFCYCSGTAMYRRYYTCNLNCVGATYVCKYAGQACV